MNQLTNMVNEEFLGHTICIDQINEVDFDGVLCLSKLICVVVAPNGNSEVLPISPYKTLGQIHHAARCFISQSRR